MNTLKHLRFISQAYKHLPGQHDQRKHGRDGGGGSGGGSGSESVALQAYRQSLDNMQFEYDQRKQQVQSAYTNGDRDMMMFHQRMYAQAFATEHRRQGAAISNMSYDEQNRIYDDLPKPPYNHMQYASAVSFALYGNPDLRMRVARDLMKLESPDDPDPTIRWEKAQASELLFRPQFDVGSDKYGVIFVDRPDKGALDVFKPFQHLSLERRLIEAENYGALDARRKYGNSDTLPAQIEFATQQAFINSFTGLHTSLRTDNIAGAMIQTTLRQIGPNAGKPLPDQFWPAGVKPPEPQPEIVRRLNNEYQTTQFNFTIGIHDQHPNVYTDANGRRYVQLYRGEKLAVDTPMQPWSQDRGVAFGFMANSTAANKPLLLRNGFVPQEYIFTSHLSQLWNTRYTNESEFLVLGAYGQDVQPSRADRKPMSETILIEYTELFYDDVQLTKTKAYDGLISRLKHLPGKHNQSSHGRKRGGSGGSGSASDTIAIEDTESRRKRNYNVDPDLQTDMFGNAIEETPTPTPTPTVDTPVPAKPRLAKYADANEVLKAAGIDVDSNYNPVVYDMFKDDLDILYTDVTMFAYDAQSYRDSAYATGFPTPELRTQVHRELAQRGEQIATRIRDKHAEMQQRLIAERGNYAEAESRYNALSKELEEHLRQFGTASSFPKLKEMGDASAEYSRIKGAYLGYENALNGMTLAIAREAFRSSMPAIMPTLPNPVSSPDDKPGSLVSVRKAYSEFAEYAYTGIDYDSSLSIGIFTTRANKNIAGSWSRKGVLSYQNATITQESRGKFTIALDQDISHYAVTMHEATHLFDDLKPGMYERTAEIYMKSGDAKATYERKQKGSTPRGERYASTSTMPYPYMKQMYYMTSSFDNDGSRTRPNRQRIYGTEFNSVMSEMILGMETRVMFGMERSEVGRVYGNPNLVGFWYANMHH